MRLVQQGNVKKSLGMINDLASKLAHKMMDQVCKDFAAEPLQFHLAFSVGFEHSSPAKVMLIAFTEKEIIKQV